jgi:hypothetical protein
MGDQREETLGMQVRRITAENKKGPTAESVEELLMALPVLEAKKLAKSMGVAPNMLYSMIEKISTERHHRELTAQRSNPGPTVSCDARSTTLKKE